MSNARSTIENNSNDTRSLGEPWNDFLKAELEMLPNSDVPEAVGDNIMKINGSFDKLNKEYGKKARAIADALIDLIQLEGKVMHACRAAAIAITENKFNVMQEQRQIAKSVLERAATQRTAFAEINFDLNPRITLMQTRLKQLNDQLSSIKLSAPKGYKFYQSRLCSIIQKMIDTNLHLQTANAASEKTEKDAFAQANAEFAKIERLHDMMKRAPNSGAAVVAVHDVKSSDPAHKTAPAIASAVKPSSSAGKVDALQNSAALINANSKAASPQHQHTSNPNAFKFANHKTAPSIVAAAPAPVAAPRPYGT